MLPALYRNGHAILGEKPLVSCFVDRKVSWVIELDSDGNLLSVSPLYSGENTRIGSVFLMPQSATRTGARIIPTVGCETATYVFGVNLDPKSDKAREAEKHQSFVARMQDCAEKTQDHRVAALCAWMKAYDDGQYPGVIPENMHVADLIGFRVNGVMITDIPAVRLYWQEHMRGLARGAGEMQCLVTGEMTTPNVSYPHVLKGIPNSNKGGVKVICMNTSASESHGLVGALNAPTNPEVVSYMSKVFNHAAQDKKHAFCLPDRMFLFMNDAGMINRMYGNAEKSSELMYDLLDSPRWGDVPVGIQNMNFQLFEVQARNSRLRELSGVSGTVREISERLCRFLKANEIVDAEGSDTRNFRLNRLTLAQMPPKVLKSQGKTQKDKTSQSKIPAEYSIVFSALNYAALHGTPLPNGQVMNVLSRIHKSSDVTPERAAILKAALVLSQKTDEEKDHMSEQLKRLDPSCNDAGYLGGRLMCELESLQRIAIGKSLQSSVGDRLYSHASSFPRDAFTDMLINAKQAHLPKIRRDKPAIENAISKRIEEIMEMMPMPLPQRFTLAEKSMFTIGYWHQKAENRRAQVQAMLKNGRGKKTPSDHAVSKSEGGLADTLGDAYDIPNVPLYETE